MENDVWMVAHYATKRDQDYRGCGEVFLLDNAWTSRQDAQSDAQRLARAHPDTNYHVLKTVEVHCFDAPATITEYDN